MSDFQNALLAVGTVVILAIFLYTLTLATSAKSQSKKEPFFSISEVSSALKSNGDHKLCVAWTIHTSDGPIEIFSNVDLVMSGDGQILNVTCIDNYILIKNGAMVYSLEAIETAFCIMSRSQEFYDKTQAFLHLFCPTYDEMQNKNTSYG